MSLPWTPTQRLALSLLLAILVLALAFRLYHNPLYISDPPPPGDRAPLLSHPIDPNTADERTLASVPKLGPSLARAIIAYRNSVPAPAFPTLDDLSNVKGIGPLTLRSLSPHLTFPSPTTHPSP